LKIVTYRDLESKASLLPLMEQAFGWPFSERRFSRFLKIDTRLRTGAVGFCALEDGKVVSYVGVMDLATRTLDGTTEHVGGIYGVATLPGYTRRGLSTALFDAAHTYFKEKGYRFSFLNTSPVLVAYSLYKKLGYSDVVYYPSAYKVLTGKAAASKKRADRKLDLDWVLAIYDAYVKGKAGFVARDKAYLEMLSKDKSLTAKGTVFGEEGYVVFRKEPHSTRIQELVASNREEAERLIEAVEHRTRDVVFARAVLDKALLRVYRSRGYTVLNDGHGVFMVKPLEADTTLEQVYGKEFFQTQLDHF
jgi:GNAT superfamily N-acetyltransferase